MTAPLVRIERGARYLTPLGRVCRWVPAKNGEQHGWLMFAYCDYRETRDDSFNLTFCSAQRLLKRLDPTEVRA